MLILFSLQGVRGKQIKAMYKLLFFMWCIPLINKVQINNHITIIKWLHKTNLKKCWNARTRWGGIFDVDAKIIQLEEEELRTQVPGFWDDPKAAELQMRKAKELKKWIEGYNEVKAAADELQLAFDFYREEAVTEEEVDAAYSHATALLEAIEMKNMLSNEEDSLGAVIKIVAGAGGTEAQDWAEMLFRM